MSFEADGKWEEVECKQGAVKASIIPVKIAQFVQERFPAQIIKKIERDPREYEIELGNGAELKFDLEFNLIDYDD